MLDDMYVEL